VRLGAIVGAAARLSFLLPIAGRPSASVLITCPSHPRVTPRSYLGFVDLYGTSFSEEYAATGYGNHLALPLIRERCVVALRAPSSLCRRPRARATWLRQPRYALSKPRSRVVDPCGLSTHALLPAPAGGGPT